LEGLDAFLTVVGAHHQRWDSLEIGQTVGEFTKASDIFKRHMSADGTITSAGLPRLHSITMANFIESEDFSQMLENCAPNLRSITMNIERPLTRKVELPKSITGLVIEDICSEINTRDFVAMLQSARIEELSLDFTSLDDPCICDYVTHNGEQRPKQFTITSVKKLNINFMADNYAEPILESLHFPALEHLTMAVETLTEDEDADDEDEDNARERGLELSEIWFAGKEFPNLKSLSLRMELEPLNPYDDDIYLPSDHIVKLAKSCPNLEDLDLECTLLTESLLLPPLRSLTLNRVIIEGTWIQDYGKRLKEDGKLDSFQRLVLNRCKVGDNALSECEWRRELPAFAGKVTVTPDETETYIRSNGPVSCVIRYGGN